MVELKLFWLLRLAVLDLDFVDGIGELGTFVELKLFEFLRLAVLDLTVGRGELGVELRVCNLFCAISKGFCAEEEEFPSPKERPSVG